MEHTTNALAGVVKVVYLKADNATFAMKNGFLSLSITADREDFEKESYPRVFLHRDFPFELPWEYISVIDEDKKEIGIIRNVTDFADEQKQLIVTELERKYYAPRIQKILSVKERYGFSYWRVVTEDGEFSFTLQDTFRSILKIDEEHAVLFDVDGNRFELNNISSLDKQSYKKIELYL